MYGNFCSRADLCLHNQIVQDGISSSANKYERWNVHMRMGQKRKYESLSATTIFLKFDTLWVKTFQIAKVNTDKTFLTCVIPKTRHCLIFAFRATNVVLDTDLAQYSWHPWPQERPLLNYISGSFGVNIFACSIYYWAEHILFFSVDIDNTPAGRWSAGSFPEHRLVIDPILAHGLLEYRHTDDVTGSLCSLFYSIC